MSREQIAIEVAKLNKEITIYCYCLGIWILLLTYYLICSVIAKNKKVDAKD